MSAPTSPGGSGPTSPGGSGPTERRVRVNGHDCRVWEKGTGAPLGFLAGLGGLPAWTPFLEALSQQRRVVAPSLPGFFGATGHDDLDGIEDWVSAALDLLEGAGLEGADLVGASVGGMLAAEVAAFSPASVRKLALMAPFGLCAAEEPVADAFARAPTDLTSAWSSDGARLAERFAPPPDEDEAPRFLLLLYRSNVAAARLLWPFGDRGLHKRLHRIRSETLLVWGSEDALVPASYAKRFADGIAGAAEIRSIVGAGHLIDLDAPDAAAEAVLAFVESL